MISERHLVKVLFLLFSHFFFYYFRETYNKYIEEGGSMTLKQQRVDVTDRVIGKMKNGEMELFLDNTPIGKMKLSDHMQVELEHHFEVEQQKIYQHVTTTEGTDAKYTDCDDGGWC
jgi:hypothetical protein